MKHQAVKVSFFISKLGGVKYQTPTHPKAASIWQTLCGKYDNKSTIWLTTYYLVHNLKGILEFASLCNKQQIENATLESVGIS